ncbi:MAG: copper transporter [Solirubrobacteraceae bacterium]
MLDFRYHALSLAAVLCALAVGVLVGVAIGDSSLVSSAQDGLVHNLRGEVRDSQRNLELAGRQLSEQQSLVTSFWPLAVHDLLAGRSVGIVFLGESSNEVDSLVQDGVKQAGGEVKSLVAVREPLPAAALGLSAASADNAGSTSEAKPIRHFGVRVGRELVVGGRLIEHDRSKLLSSYDGQLEGLEGIVVMRSEPAGMSAEAARQTHEFESGLIAGIKTEGVEAVGVEMSSTEPSQVSWYKAEGLSSVDDIENVGGRAALAFALGGYRGAFGDKSSADALLPSMAGAPAGSGHP